MTTPKTTRAAAITGASLLVNIKQAGRVSLDLHGGGAGAGHSLRELVLAEQIERAEAAGMGAGDTVERVARVLRAAHQGVDDCRTVAVRDYKGDKTRDDAAARAAADAAFAARGPAQAAIASATARARADAAAVSLIASQAARKQAGRVKELRGVSPSVTSIDDAAAVAAVAVATARQFAPCLALGARVPVALALLTANGAADKFEVGADEWAAAGGNPDRMARRWAARAAWSSLVHWASGGASCGDLARDQRDKLPAFIGGEAGAVLLAGVPCEAADARGVADWHATRGERWAMARRLYRLAWLPFASRAGRGSGPLRQGARARGRFLACVVLGFPVEQAAARAGFSSVASFVESATTAGLAASLRADLIAAADWRAVAFKIGKRYHGARVRRALRSLHSATTGAEPWRVGYGQSQRANGARARRSLSSNLARRAAVADIAAAADAARFNAARHRASIAAAAAAADNLWAGFQRRQWRTLAAVAGVTDERGARRGLGKADASLIRRSKGSIGDKSARAGKAADAAACDTVSIGGRRAVPCAKLV